jgi:hypothetical protein
MELFAEASIASAFRIKESSMTQQMNSPIIVAGCLLFFAEHADAVRNSDVLDSLLYCQLAAAKRHEKFSEFENWKDTWLAASLRFGWALQRSEHISEPVPRGPAETVWDICARALMSANVGAALVGEAERQARQPPQAEALALLAGQTLQAESDPLKPGASTLGFQVGFVDAHGNLTIAVLHFVTRQLLSSDFLFEPLEATSLGGNIELTVCSMRLVDHVYGQFREAFAAALLDRRAALIKPWAEALNVEQS